jgi:wobble nucleotide-excising tRNase
MIERFEKITKTGLFEDYTHAPGCEFGEVTLAYGENGTGKSTLAAILDSLRERNAKEIIRRCSLPGDVPPAIVVRMGGKDYTFNGMDWDDQPPYDTLDVFYPGFVTRNVHAATGVDAEHRRNLCELVLGRKAVEKVALLASADTEGRSALTDLKAIEKQLDLIIKKPDTLVTFAALSHDQDITKKLDAVRAEIKEAQSREAILKRPIPKEAPLPTIAREAIAQFLERSTDVIAANVGAVVKAHIKQHLDAEGEKWLAYGAKHIANDDLCPFCAQDVTPSQLVPSIRAYFGEEYRKYTDTVRQDGHNIRTQLGSAVFPQIRTGIANQLAITAQWVDVTAVDQNAAMSLMDEAEEAWKSAATKLGPLVAGKEARPLERIDAGQADESLAEYGRAIASITKVNSILAAAIKQVEARRAALSAANMTEIELRLNRLENQKTRFEPLAQDLLDKRNKLIEKRAAVEAKKVQLKKEIDEDAAKVVGKYQAGINHYLAYFGCDIRIESVEPGFPSGKASVQYTLKAHGHAIELGTSAVKPCFETVLSDGDKYTLALSFFFARLKDHTVLTGRTVVLDDPVNSLGISRRTLIEGIIRDLRQRGAQVVVLTHDERLAAMMWRDRQLKNIAPLQVERTRTGSRLKPWDVEHVTQSDYVDHYLSLVNYLDNGGDHKAPAGCIRPYVEQRLRYLYPGPPFETRDTLGQMIGKIRVSAPGSRLDALKVKLPELVAINDAALPSHHATDDVPGMPPLTPDGVRLFAQKALDVLE